MEEYNNKTYSEISYKDIVEIIKNMPKTYYPALFIELIEISLKKNVWQKGGLVKIAERMDEEFFKEKVEISSEDIRLTKERWEKNIH